MRIDHVIVPVLVTPIAPIVGAVSFGLSHWRWTRTFLLAGLLSVIVYRLDYYYYNFFLSVCIARAPSVVCKYLSVGISFPT